MLTKGLHPHVHRCRVCISWSRKDSTLSPRSSQNGSHDGTFSPPSTDRTEHHYLEARSFAELPRLSSRLMTCGSSNTTQWKESRSGRTTWFSSRSVRARFYPPSILIQSNPTFPIPVDLQLKARNSLVFGKSGIKIHGLYPNKLQILINNRCA